MTVPPSDPRRPARRPAPEDSGADHESGDDTPADAGAGSQPPVRAAPYGPAAPYRPADEQMTTALPRPPRGAPRSADPSAADRHPLANSLPDYQETTVLRRPPQAPAASNIPGAGRENRGAVTRQPTADESQPAARAPRERDGSHLPPYAGPAVPDAPQDYHAAESYDPDSEDALPPSARGRGRTPGEPRRGLRREPQKLTVTRVAALRSRELTHRGLEKFHDAVSADGADRSGLSHLTYAVMANYAVDAALTVGLANTLFFAAAKADSTGKVLLYLLLTVAPFAVIAPLIGPALDKLQRGRRVALAASSVGRTALAVVMALNFDSWVIYPCALGMLVLSKGFGVLKAALTPRVLPEAITLVKTNSRLSVFGLIAGGASGAIAAGIAALTDSSGALWFTAACGLVGAWLCLRIPSWVESTVGELPIHHTGAIDRPRRGPVERTAEATIDDSERRGLPRVIVTALWSNSVIRLQTGFLGLFIAFVIKTRFQNAPALPTPGIALGAGSDHEGWKQLLLLGAIGAAAGLGGFLGNAIGAKLQLRNAELVALWCVASAIVAVVVAFIVPGLVSAGGVALVGATASALAKVCLDATMQQNLSEASRASAFGRSESVLQLSWVTGGVIGLLIGGVWTLTGDTVYLVGFGIVGLLMIFGLAQCIAVRLGRSLLPTWRSVFRTLTRRSGTGSATGAGAGTATAKATPKATTKTAGRTRRDARTGRGR